MGTSTDAADHLAQLATLERDSPLAALAHLDAEVLRATRASASVHGATVDPGPAAATEHLERAQRLLAALNDLEGRAWVVHQRVTPQLGAPGAGYGSHLCHYLMALKNATKARLAWLELLVGPCDTGGRDLPWVFVERRHAYVTAYTEAAAIEDLLRLTRPAILPPRVSAAHDAPRIP